MWRRIKYLFQIIPIYKIMRDWYKLPILMVTKSKITLTLRSGQKFTIPHLVDALTIKEVFFDKDYDIIMRNPKIIIDIGANTGTASVFYATKYPKCTILAYEPSLRTFEILKSNIKLNNVTQVKPFQKAVSEEKGKKQFYSHPASGLSSLFDIRPGTKKETVTTTTLSEIFERNDIKKCDLVKMDCEGSEYGILFNCSSHILEKIDSLVMEYHDTLTNYVHEDIIGFLLKNNFKTICKPNHLNPEIGIIYAWQ